MPCLSLACYFRCFSDFFWLLYSFFMKLATCFMISLPPMWPVKSKYQCHQNACYPINACFLTHQMSTQQRLQLFQLVAFATCNSVLFICFTNWNLLSTGTSPPKTFKESLHLVSSNTSDVKSLCILMKG